MKTLLFIFLLENSRNDIPVLVFENTGKAGPGECHALIIYCNPSPGLIQTPLAQPENRINSDSVFESVFENSGLKTDSKRKSKQPQNSPETFTVISPIKVLYQGVLTLCITPLERGDSDFLPTHRFAFTDYKNIHRTCTTAQVDGYGVMDVKIARIALLYVQLCMVTNSARNLKTTSFLEWISMATMTHPGNFSSDCTYVLIVSPELINSTY